MQRTLFALKDPNVDIDNISQAFDAVFDKYLLRSLITPLDTQMGLLDTTLDVLKKDKRYSLEVALKLILALGVGGLTGLFNLKPTIEIFYVLAYMTKHYGGYLKHRDLLIHIFQPITIARSSLLATYSAVRLIDTYKPAYPPSVAELFLIKENATSTEEVGYYTRVAGSLVSASCANIPVFLTCLSLGIPFATAITLAAIAINWFGVNNITKSLRRQTPAHRTLITFLHMQVDAFSILEPAVKQEHIQALRNIINRPDAAEKIRKEVFLYLLKLGIDANASLKLAEKPWHYHLISYTFWIMGAIPQLNFTESTIKGVTHLSFFKSPTSGPAVTSAVFAGMFAAVPAIGFSRGCLDASEKFRSNAKPIANNYHRLTRKITEFGMIIWNMLAFGTIALFAYYCMKDLTQLVNMEREKSIRLEIAFMTLCSLLSTMTISHYFINLMQSIFAFYAQRNGNDNTRLEVLFESGLHGLVGKIEHMSDQNFLDLMRSYIHVADDASAADKALSAFIKNLIRANCPAEYEKICGSEPVLVPERGIEMSPV